MPQHCYHYISILNFSPESEPSVTEQSNSDAELPGASIADEDLQSAIVDDDVLAEVVLAQRIRESTQWQCILLAANCFIRPQVEAAYCLSKARVTRIPGTPSPLSL